MVFAGVSHSRGHFCRRHQRKRHSRHRNHQSEGNDDRMGRRVRRACIQRHCLAGQAHFLLLRQPQEGRPCRPDPQQDRTDNRCIFQRDKGKMDTGQCSRCTPQGRRRMLKVRHGGHMAHLEAHQRRSPCHGRKQRLQDHALQHPYPRLGRRASEAFQHTEVDDASGEVFKRNIRKDKRNDLRL